MPIINATEGDGASNTAKTFTLEACRHDITEYQGRVLRYSLYVGWYGCAAVLTPFFDILGIEQDVLGVLFLIHQHQNDLLGS